VDSHIFCGLQCTTVLSLYYGSIQSPTFNEGCASTFQFKIDLLLGFDRPGGGGYAVYSKVCYNVRRFDCSQEFVSGSTVEYLEDVFSFCGVVSYFWW